jgi:hypothetical protein
MWHAANSQKQLMKYNSGNKNETFRQNCALKNIGRTVIEETH